MNALVELKVPVVTDVTYLPESSKELVSFTMNKNWETPLFKLEHFVGNQEITPFGKLRQWLLEVKSREEAIAYTIYNKKKIELEIDLEKENLEQTFSPAAKALIEHEIQKKQQDLLKTDVMVKDAYKERDYLLHLIEQLLESPEGKTADGRPLTDVFGTPEEELYHKQYWTLRLAKQASMDMLSMGRIGSGNMEAIVNLDADTQSQVFAIANDYSLKLENQQLQIRQEVSKQLGLNASTIQDARKLEMPLEIL
jgi:hypothetical protein